MGTTVGKMVSEMSSWSSWAEEEKKKLVDILGRPGTRSNNVLLVGKPGAGKSSFCTSMECALTETPSQEVGSAGQFNSGASFTLHLRRHKLFKDQEDLKVCGFVRISSIIDKMPVFYDMPGMQNKNEEGIAAILRCIILGRVQPNEDIVMSASLTAREVMNKFPQNSESRGHMIDRVVFVHSAAEPVPENLIKCVVSICKEYGA